MPAKQTPIEKLRDLLLKLKKDLETATMEKGLAADENKDLRENSTYDYWEQKESMFIIRIHRTMKEIRDLSKPKTPKLKKKPSKSKAQPVIKGDFQKHKWL
jgi:hypothetical protein